MSRIPFENYGINKVNRITPYSQSSDHTTPPIFLGKALLHGDSAADESAAFQFPVDFVIGLHGGFIFGCGQKFARDFAVNGGNHVADDMWSVHVVLLGFDLFFNIIISVMVISDL